VSWSTESFTWVAAARAFTTPSSVSRLVGRVALHRLDEVRDEVGAALVLVLDLGPGGADGVLGLRDRLGSRSGGERGDRGDGEEPERSHGRQS